MEHRVQQKAFDKHVLMATLKLRKIQTSLMDGWLSQLYSIYQLRKKWTGLRFTATTGICTPYICSLSPRHWDYAVHSLWSL